MLHNSYATQLMTDRFLNFLYGSQWYQDDVILVPAGTIHAIGAGLVIAEIQQRSDATFRLFDYGSQRELHIDSAITVASTTPANFQTQQRRLTHERTLLTSSPHFVFERFDLAPNSVWRQKAERETWLLVLRGTARTGAFDVSIGDAIFAQADQIHIHSGLAGLVCLAAYAAGDPVPHLLQSLVQPESEGAERQADEPTSTSLVHTSKTPTVGRVETIQ